MIVIADSSFLIGLSKIRKTLLLYKLFHTVHIPQSVHKEVVEAGKEGSLEISGTDYIVKKPIQDTTLLSFFDHSLGEGEKEVILLGKEMGADLLLLDDMKARKIARAVGFTVLGLLGFLVLAKKKGLLPEIRPLVTELKQKGFYIADRLVQSILEEVNE